MTTRHARTTAAAAMLVMSLGAAPARAQEPPVDHPVLQAPPARPQKQPPAPAWLGLAGSGLFTLPDIKTMVPGQFVVGINVDNRDRDPLGIDLLDGALTWNVGLTRRMETYGRLVASRVVTVPGRRMVLPPPPLDMIVPEAAQAPARPYYPLFSLTPYVNDRRGARFSHFVPGDVLFGAKYRFTEPRGSRPGLAAALQLTIPMPQGLADLQSGGGTGTVDLAARGIAEWRFGTAWALTTSALYVHTGSTPYGDRLVHLEPTALGRTVGRPDDMPLSLPNRLELGVGARRVIRPWLAAVAEINASFEVGYRTYALDRITPVDLLGGVQISHRRLRAALALRYHGNAAHTGDLRPSPLAGAVDLTDVAAAPLGDYLKQVGAESALDWLRGRSQRVLLSPPSGVPLPPGAQVIPAQYRIESEHQVGFMIALGWAF
jgi:hypothetical protein